MDAITAAPLLCAGVTVFNALRGTNEKAKQPAIVAVVGWETNENPVFLFCPLVLKSSGIPAVLGRACPCGSHCLVTVPVE